MAVRQESELLGKLSVAFLGGGGASRVAIISPLSA